MSDYITLTGSPGYQYLAGTKWSIPVASAMSSSSQEPSLVDYDDWLDYDVWKSKELYVYETNHIDSFQSIQLKQNTKLLKII